MISEWQLTSARRRFEKVAQETEAQLKRLHDREGNPIYAPQEYQRRRRAALGVLYEAHQELSDTLSEAYRDAEKAREALTDSDMSAWLSESELEQANQRAAFIREDASLLPIPELVGRAQRAREKGDKVAMFLYARYLGIRNDDTVRASREEPNATRRQRMVAGLDTLREEIAAMRQELIPESIKKDAERADELTRTSLEIRRVTSQRVREIDGSRERLEQQTRARINL